MTKAADADWAGKLKAFVRDEVRSLTTIQPSDRPWQLPVAAALSNALPLFVGAYFDRLEHGVVASLGGLTFLYLPRTPLAHRMATIMACAFVLIACYALGLASQLAPVTMVPTLVFISVVSTMLCRFYGLGPPGSLFFVMVASIGAYTETQARDVPFLVGLVALGALLACLVAFVYSLVTLAKVPMRPVTPLPKATFDFVVLDPLIIGLSIGLALALAQLLRVERAYWVPVACVAVMQGATLRAVWTRQVHRLIGTALGLFVTGGLFLLPLDKWSVAAIIFVLMFVVEVAVVRHYGFAAIFITPMAILLAEAATAAGPMASGALMQARFMDTLLGVTVGFLGGVGLHHRGFRETVGKRLRRLAARERRA